MNLLKTLCSSWRSLRPTAQQSPGVSSDTARMQVLRRLRRRTQPRGLGSCYMFVVVLGFSSWAQAFDLQQLSDQLARPDVIHGHFIQEKHLRALPQPLTSKGTFVLAKNNGLLWLLKTPLQQDYRITTKGIARRDANGWQMLPGKSAGAEQNRLFLAVLQGDSSGLQRDFELSLTG